MQHSAMQLRNRAHSGSHERGLVQHPDMQLTENVCAGIFVNDIMDAVPIDKYFELFKPGQGGEGGFIRIGMDYTKSLKDRDGKSAGGVLSHARAPQSSRRCAVLCLQ